jgi:hypothetical protein
MSFCCSACEVNWWPHQAAHQRCPMCGAGTVGTDDPVSEDADLLYRIARAEADKREAFVHFERHYAWGEENRRAA